MNAAKVIRCEDDVCQPALGTWQIKLVAHALDAYLAQRLSPDDPGLVEAMERAYNTAPCSFDETPMQAALRAAIAYLGKGEER